MKLVSWISYHHVIPNSYNLYGLRRITFSLNNNLKALKKFLQEIWNVAEIHSISFLGLLSLLKVLFFP